MAEPLIKRRRWRAPLLAWSEARRETAALLLTPASADLPDLAARVGVEEIKALEARVRFVPWLDGVEMQARLAAVSVRTCGVSLELFEERTEETFARRFLPEGSRFTVQGRWKDGVVDPQSPDPPDVVGEGIDLTAVVVEEFALALTPFPRKPGAVFEAPSPAPVPSPFSILGRLTDRS